MRWVWLALMTFIGALNQTGYAQTGPLVRTVSSHISMGANDQGTYRLQCPAGYVPTLYSLSPQYPYDWNTEMSRDLIDASRAIINRASLSASTPLMGGGVAVAIYNEEHHQHELQIKVVCLSTAATTDNILSLARSTDSVAKLSSATALVFCPPEFPVALGGFSNADGRVVLSDRGTGPVWGTSASPVLLTDQPEGQTGPPTGWQVKVANASFFNAAEVIAFAVCGKAPTVQAFIYSATVPQGVFGAKTAFSIFGAVPDGWTAIGLGFDGGPYAEYFSTNLWIQDGVVVDMLQWDPASKGYDSGAAEVRAFIARAGGDTPRGASSRAVMAVLAVPKAGSAVSIVDVVEFYHSGLDHFFITAIAKEIADLDGGVHPGWARTGSTFKAYAPGSGGRTGRRPVCRAYGRPEAGLDSHFYSASPDECSATLVNGYGYEWGLEASEVFQMDLPDPITGVCPSGGIPVYRTFNQRKDANHRYTTSMAIRDQMVAKGGIAEGYGPSAAALCALP